MLGQLLLILLLGQLLLILLPRSLLVAELLLQVLLLQQCRVGGHAIRQSGGGPVSCHPVMLGRHQVRSPAAARELVLRDVAAAMVQAATAACIRLGAHGDAAPVLRIRARSAPCAVQQSVRLVRRPAARSGPAVGCLGVEVHAVHHAHAALLRRPHVLLQVPHVQHAVSRPEVKAPTAPAHVRCPALPTRSSLPLPTHELRQLLAWLRVWFQLRAALMQRALNPDKTFTAGAPVSPDLFRTPTPTPASMCAVPLAAWWCPVRAGCHAGGRGPGRH